MDVIVALLVDYKILELPDSEESRTKRQVTPFYILRLPDHPITHQQFNKLTD